MSDDLDIIKELIDAFVDEADQLHQEAYNCAAAAKSEPGDEYILEALEECFHTIKQRVGFFEFAALIELTGALEAMLIQTRTTGASLTSEQLALIDQGLVAVADGFAMLQDHNTSGLAVDHIVRQIHAQTHPTNDAIPPEAQVADIGMIGNDEPLIDALDEADDTDDTDESLIDDEPLIDDEADEVDDTDDADNTPEMAAKKIKASSSGTADTTPDTPVDADIPSFILELEKELAALEVIEGPPNEDVSDFVPDFIMESNEILEQLDENLVHLEEAADNLDLLNEIFRVAHTLKGTASFLGFAQMSAVTHKMETVLDLLRQGQMALTQEIMDVVLQGVDLVKLLQSDIRANQIVNRDITAVCKALVHISETRSAPATIPATIPATKPPAAATAAPDTAVAAAQKSPALQEADQVIRVDIGRVDTIMTLAEELVLGRNRLLQLNSQLSTEQDNDELVNRLNETTAQVGTLTGELQESVMMIRMVPASRIFSRFPRMVRDLARTLNKQIQLSIEDNDTELDKSVADEISDPLVHLIRNAVDHGIETPEARVAAGKPPHGTVILSAAHEGNSILIRIQDDGHGMDPEKLKRKAIEKGIIEATDAKSMADREAYDLIFAPGFSTAKEITDVSGRGVGMDVVKTNIASLKGTIALDSTLGQGTQVLIRLPLTLAIINGLQIGVGEEIFILPLGSVVEALKVETTEIETHQGRKVIRARDKVLPLIDLRHLLSVPGVPVARTDQYVVVTALGERQIGILVDHLMGQVEIVIKALSDMVGPATGIAGATILGDGRVRLILDVAQLIDVEKILSKMEHECAGETPSDHPA